MNYPNVEAVLNRLGLWKALRGMPAMAALVVIFVAIAHIALPAISLFSDLPSPQFNLSAVVVGIVLALIGYFLGNFWDAKVFDPLYGPTGRWVGRSTRPFGLLPAGDDLQRARTAAIAKLVPNAPEGKGIYRAAVIVAGKSRAKWAHIEQPLILSKFLRAFIWPTLLASLALLGSVMWQEGVGELGSTSIVAIGAVLGFIFVLLFVPYINLRVEHMQRLYEHVSRSGTAS